jgi:hypothetical protein
VFNQPIDTCQMEVIAPTQPAPATHGSGHHRDTDRQCHDGCWPDQAAAVGIGSLLLPWCMIARTTFGTRGGWRCAAANRADRIGVDLWQPAPPSSVLAALTADAALTAVGYAPLLLPWLLRMLAETAAPVLFAHALIAVFAVALAAL